MFKVIYGVWEDKMSQNVMIVRLLSEQKKRESIGEFLKSPLCVAIGRELGVKPKKLKIRKIRRKRTNECWLEITA